MHVWQTLRVGSGHARLGHWGSGMLKLCRHRYTAHLFSSEGGVACSNATPREALARSKPARGERCSSSRSPAARWKTSFKSPFGKASVGGVAQVCIQLEGGARLIF